ncbi:hypothetical protein JWV37_10755 [Sulfurospirillum sp. T05]|uniref:Uncharacterized protein n=1 Tax=Sulfurospirillum tamanense TaxID=2813362 RepID=A0ABS2WUC2_9BACT|nr:hypothetical protein [Sulfurospirillum tamanensis]MBN2965262.1 hypothetical protein [Sulfurospirillum tamanensis]
MKKFLLLLFVVSSLLFGEDDSLNVRPTQDVRFTNGFGTIFAKPMLNDKNLQEKITLQGQFNVDHQNNVEIVFDKVQYQGKLYTLNSAFVKKSRLRDRNAVLTRESDFVVVGGNRDELLNVLNLEAEPTDEKDVNDKLAEAGYGGGSTNNYSSPSGSGFTPTYTTDSKDGDNGSSWQPTNDATMIVDCPAATLVDGLATYYAQQGTVCVKQTSNSVYEKYDTRSCRNKIDYKNNQISLGYEMYVTTPEGQDIMVQRCQYEEPIELRSEVGSCKATADFANDVAIVSKQFYYTHENQRVNVGQCVPTDITVPLERDMNACTYDRHDFVAGFSYPQAQYFYRYENVKRNIGECVDATGFAYEHYMDDTTCDWEVVDGRVFYRQRVAYQDLLGVKRFATDCQTTSSGGMEVHEEFAGYNFYDVSKQAIRKINTYFYVPGTTQKVFVDQNVETAKAYPYIEQQCGIENDDEALQTHFSKRTIINDTDEDKEVEVSPCQVHQTMPYQKLSTTEVLVQTLTNQLIEPTGTGYKILGTDKALTGQPNWTRNTATYTSAIQNVPRWYATYGQLVEQTKNICTGGTLISGKIGDFSYSYRYFPYTGTWDGWWQQITSCNVIFSSSPVMVQATAINIQNLIAQDGEDSHPHTQWRWQFSLKNGYADNQLIEVVEAQQDYVRGDGTTYTQPNSGTLSYIAK